MDKLVATTFKILFMSIMFMFLLDTVLLLTEVISIHSSITNISGLIQTEIARNNCLPANMAQGFTKYLDDISGRSRIMEGTGDIQTNFYNDLTLNSTKYDNLTEDNCKNYGEITTLAIGVTLRPAYVYIGQTVQSTHRLGRIAAHVNYVYQVPCLRYLK